MAAAIDDLTNREQVFEIQADARRRMQTAEDDIKRDDALRAAGL